MQQQFVTSSLEEPTAPPVIGWEQPDPSWGSTDSAVDTGGLSDGVPHFVIQKKFYDEKDFVDTVKTIREGSRFDTIWHYCPAQNCNAVGIGRESSDIDPRLGISTEQVNLLKQKYGLQREFQVVSNYTLPRIRAERKEVEVCYPLYYWMVIRGDAKVMESESCLMTEHVLDVFPSLIPHARKVLGRATRQVLIYQWQCMRDLNEKLEALRANPKVLSFYENARLLGSFRLSLVDAPLKRDPIVLTCYDLDHMCDGTRCETFARSGCLETGDWLFRYSY